MRRRLAECGGSTTSASGGERSDVTVDLVDVVNALGAQGWELTTALPLRDTDTLLLIVRRAVAETPTAT